MNIDAVAIPYELPEADNHSSFFIDQRVETRLEAKLHRHDAWELYCVLQGRGTRTAGDTTQLFMEGDVVLIPPDMYHNPENRNPSGLTGCRYTEYRQPT